MGNGNGAERDVWVMVDHDGHRTLYELVKMGKEAMPSSWPANFMHQLSLLRWHYPLSRRSTKCLVGD